VSQPSTRRRGARMASEDSRSNMDASVRPAARPVVGPRSDQASPPSG
jgi:hypothetical protein